MIKLHEGKTSINNNGYGHSLNEAPIKHDNFKFRTLYETYFHDALKERGLCFSPLPVFTYAGKRVEPDFLVLINGSCLFIELDGSSHCETMLQAERRLKFLKQNLAEVYRIEVPSNADLDWARSEVKKVESHIQKTLYSAIGRVVKCL